MSVPNSANVNASLYFIIVPECVRRYYKLVPNLECLGQKSRQSNTEIEDSLINSKLKIIAHTRLADHITSHISLNFSDHHWKFMIYNIRQISAMLKMSNMCSSDEMLQTINWNDTLLNNDHHRNREVLKVEHSKEEHCYFIVHDK